MSDLLLDQSARASPPSLPFGGLQEALMESRQRWRQVASLAADLTFETDAEGRFVLMIPPDALGWPPDSLIGQPSALLVSDDDVAAGCNPFRPTQEMRRHRAWIKRPDGTMAMMAVSAMPILDQAGDVVGARGVGIDTTESDADSAQIAARLRREQLLHHILSRVAGEIDVDSMMDAALWGLIHALGAEGSAVIGVVSDGAAPDVLHECGPGASDVLATACRLAGMQDQEPNQGTNPDERLVLAIGCETRAGLPAGLAIWRKPGSRGWDQDDMAVAHSAIGIVQMVLDYNSLQREMAHQARTDPLTGLLNRRAFIDELQRQFAWLDRASEPGTMLFVDMDAFKSVNDRLGHAMGDQILVHLSDLLRQLVRPFDLITRLGGDEFAIWLSGADHMTAAERADYLCKTVPGELQALLPESFPTLGVSIGIATRRAGSLESIEELTRRADMAMYEVKRSGRCHWRVSLRDDG